MVSSQSRGCPNGHSIPSAWHVLAQQGCDTQITKWLCFCRRCSGLCILSCLLPQPGNCSFMRLSKAGSEPEAPSSAQWHERKGGGWEKLSRQLGRAPVGSSGANSNTLGWHWPCHLLTVTLGKTCHIMGLSFLIYDMVIGRECMQGAWDGAWDTTARPPDVTGPIW